jgi:hypothetical protein
VTYDRSVVFSGSPVSPRNTTPKSAIVNGNQPISQVQITIVKRVHNADIKVFLSFKNKSDIYIVLLLSLLLLLQWNLSNPTHQETSEMCQIGQDVGILRFYFSQQKYFGTVNFCCMSQVVEKLRCRIAQVPLYYYYYYYY